MPNKKVLLKNSGEKRKKNIPAGAVWVVEAVAVVVGVDVAVKVVEVVVVVSGGAEGVGRVAVSGGAEGVASVAVSGGAEGVVSVAVSGGAEGVGRDTGVAVVTVKGVGGVAAPVGVEVRGGVEVEAGVVRGEPGATVSGGTKTLDGAPGVEVSEGVSVAAEGIAVVVEAFSVIVEVVVVVAVGIEEEEARGPKLAKSSGNKKYPSFIDFWWPR